MLNIYLLYYSNCVFCFSGETKKLSDDHSSMSLVRMRHTSNIQKITCFIIHFNYLLNFIFIYDLQNNFITNSLLILLLLLCN